MDRRDREEWGVLADSEAEDIDLGEERMWTSSHLQQHQARRGARQREREWQI
jgi:hypothetical protein